MRKIVAGLFVSLDGVAETPEQWHFPYVDGEMMAALGAQMDAADTMLLGRRTYQEMAAYWPNQSSREVPFADHMNDTPKLVVSSTLDSVDEWQNSTLINGEVVKELTELKQGSGKNISTTGSITLVRSLLENDLLDELYLLVDPIVVGKGRRLFETEGGPVPLKLTESTILGSGVLSLTYTKAETTADPAGAEG